MTIDLAILSVAHLLVDGVCAATLFGRLGGEPALAAMVTLYSTLAFSTQGFVGLAADRLRRHVPAGAASMLLVALGYALPMPAWLRVWIIGLGNSAFHVAGGTMTLEDSAGRAGKLGVFVAPGAIGLTAGTLWPGLGGALAALLTACAALLLLVHRDGLWARRDVVAPAEGPAHALPAIALLTLSVAVRAIGGTAVRFPWNAGGGLAMLLTLFVFAGKSAGGFVCDRLGAKRSAWLSIVPAAALIAFCARWMVPSLLGQFALNLTMPVTLWLLYRAMPDSPGFAFGLAASALWPGTIVGRAMALTGPWLWLCVVASFAFGLGAILYAERRILRE